MTEERVTALVIGDPHFKHNNIERGKEFVKRCLNLSKKLSPTFNVVLGDVLHTHESIHVLSYNLACDFIGGLADIAPTYVLIGNHDYIDNQQFLTTNHGFNPLKEWDNVTIVDKPIMIDYGSGYNFVFVPYVPNGRFKDALNTLVSEELDSWETSDCIFAHQEFLGCSMGKFISEKGDSWDENFPPVISGHIHDSQVVGKNIFYPGSAIQHSFHEGPNKSVWHVQFQVDDEPPYLSYTKHNLGMKKKKIIKTTPSEYQNLDIPSLKKKYEIKLKIEGSEEEIQIFRKSNNFLDLKQQNIRFDFKPITNYDLELPEREDVSFLGVLKQLVEKKSEPIQEAYQEINSVLS